MGPSKAADVRTRRTILNLLKIEGPIDVATLASKLGLTTMAVRLHLQSLRDENLAVFHEEPRPMGRPAKMWELTPAADKFFPAGNEELAAGLITSIVNEFGSEGLDRVIAERTNEQKITYRKAVPLRLPLSKRVAALAKIRTEQGYMATVKRGSDGCLLLMENHCPICAIARKCVGLCKRELELFQHILGENVRIERVEHIVAGGRRCTYRIEDDRKNGSYKERHKPKTISDC